MVRNTKKLYRIRDPFPTSSELTQADPYGPACVHFLSEKYRVSVRRFISRLKLFLDASQAVACVVVLFQIGHYFLGRF